MFITNEALIHRGAPHLVVTRGILDGGEVPDILPEL